MARRCPPRTSPPRPRRRNLIIVDAYLAVVSKREVRAYAPRELEPEVEQRILEAGRVAGSSKNRQARRFVVVRDDGARPVSLAEVFVFLNMHALNRPEVMISNAAQRFDAQGHLTDTTSRDLIRQLLRNLVDWTRQLREPVVKA